MVRHFWQVMVIASLVCCCHSGKSWADDVESDLLNQFQNQNKTAANKLKQEATRLLNERTSSNHTPEKKLAALRKLLDQLDKDIFLPGSERTALIRKLQDRLRECKSVVES